MNKSVSRRRHGWRSAVVLTMAVALASAGLQSTPVAAVIQPPTTAPTQQPAKTAAQRAAEAGEPVEVIEKRTESSKTFANPNGTFTLEQSAVPLRKERDGQWVDLDPSLSRGSDGVVRPAATAMEMEFAGGGTNNLVTLNKNGQELSLTWPEPLPEPVIEGDSMTYGSVYPGVDLQVNVTKDSFSQVLIVHTPQAAKLPQLQEIELGVEAPGMTTRPSPGGGVEVVDQLGTVVFSAPKPVMWDSAGEGKAEPDSADRTEAPLEGDTVAAMPLEVSDGGLAVTPVRALADAPGTVYPLHIDPTVRGDRIARSMINEHYPSTPYWGWGGDEGVGYQAFEPWSRKRLFFGFNTAKVAKAHILSATFTAFETWTASCTAKVVEVWKTARVTENTNWTAGSGSSVWQQRLAVATVAHGREGCNPGGYWVPFNVTSAVAQQASVGGSSVYLGMRAADESDQNAWKRFRYDAILSVNYNFPPTVVNPRTQDPVTSCVTNTTNDPVIGGNRPWPVVGVTDPDRALGDQAMVEFQIRRAVDVAPLWTGVSGYMEPASDVPFKPAARPGALGTNTTYAWRARAWDGDSNSPWTAECFFQVDMTKPPQPTITPVTEGPHGLGSPVSFKITSPSSDVTGFRYAFDTFSPGSAVIPKANGNLTATPTHIGPWYVRAWSVDAAGNPSDDYGEAMLRVGGPDVDGKWSFDENSGTSSVDGSGKSRTMFLGTGAAWTEGDRHYLPDAPDYAVYLPGLQTSGATTATTATDIVDTGNNFSVTARVQLGIKSNRQVILSEDRPGQSSFTLGTTEMRWTGKDTPDPADDIPSEREVKYSFTIATNDTAGPAKLETTWQPYVEGQWVSLAAVYTAGEHHLELFVDGVSKSNGSFNKTLAVTDGAGPFRTGLAIDGGTTHFLRGTVDDIRLYQNVIDKATIDAHANGDS